MFEMKMSINELFQPRSRVSKALAVTQIQIETVMALSTEHFWIHDMA
jgi:hypothetical protein